MLDSIFSLFYCSFCEWSKKIGDSTLDAQFGASDEGAFAHPHVKYHKCYERVLSENIDAANNVTLTENVADYRKSLAKSIEALENCNEEFVFLIESWVGATNNGPFSKQYKI